MSEKDMKAIAKRANEAAEALVEAARPRMSTQQIPGLALVIQRVAEWAYARGVKSVAEGRPEDA